MSKSQSLQRLFARAKVKGKKYDWAEAAELYKQALGMVGKRDFFEERGDSGEDWSLLLSSCVSN